MLIIYVDDFKMAGPKAEVDQCWEAMCGESDKGYIEMGKRPPVDHFLGCKHERTTITLASGKQCKHMVYNMQSFMESCVNVYEELVGQGFA